ncbi:MAG: trypsin-like peptidase domain-containing protein [Myxococcales bacterium]|nr:trypsin-like peptidase domain-containing protein [Myxococcales bacterium]
MRCLLTLFLLCSVFGCAPVDEGVEGPSVEPIVRGRLSSRRPSACLLDGARRRCSATLIAPDLVITAGHCVAPGERYTVWCANEAASVAVSAWFYAPEYPNREAPTRRTIDNDAGPDLALVQLARPLDEAVPATLGAGAALVGRRVRAYGRVHRQAVGEAIVQSGRFVLTHRDPRRGFYVGADRVVLEPGDSGGGLFDDDTGELLGVASSGTGSGRCLPGQLCDLWCVFSPVGQWLREARDAAEAREARRRVSRLGAPGNLQASPRRGPSAGAAARRDETPLRAPQATPSSTGRRPRATSPQPLATLQSPRSEPPADPLAHSPRAPGHHRG